VEVERDPVKRDPVKRDPVHQNPQQAEWPFISQGVDWTQRFSAVNLPP